MTYFLGKQSRNIRFLGTLIKKTLLYASIVFEKKGAPDCTVGTHKNTKNSKKTTKSYFWVYSEVTSKSWEL